MLSRFKEWYSNLSIDIGGKNSLVIDKVEDEEDALYFLILELPYDDWDREAKKISEAWKQQMEESYLIILDGKNAYSDSGNFRVRESTIQDTFETYCSECKNSKLYNVDMDMFYCPVCD